MIIELLSDKSEYREDIESVKNDWIEALLIYAGVDIEHLNSLEPPEQIEALIGKYEIDLITYPSLGAVKIDKSGETIGEWCGPKLVLRKDEDDEELYYKITIETWTIMEEEIDMN